MNFVDCFGALFIHKCRLDIYIGINDVWHKYDFGTGSDIDLYEKGLRTIIADVKNQGAKVILCDPHRAVVLGNNFKTPLKGIKMSSPDIRAGMALLIASISAEGISVIENANQIHRGYENIINKLTKIGVKIHEKK